MAQKPEISLPAIHAEALIIEGADSVTATASIRRTFAIRHLKAAEHFARTLGQLESEHAGAGLGNHFDLCSWNATAAIVISFAAIEAALDEAEEDLNLPLELARVIERSPTLDRAQAILAHRGVAPFDRGAEPFQGTDLLRAIRNGLVHPRAEWDHAQDINKRLSQRILGSRLPLSPFWPDQYLAFPHGCMSAGVAVWAVNTAREFIVCFRQRLGLPVPDSLANG